MIFDFGSKVNIRKLLLILLYVSFFSSRLFAHAELQEIYPSNLDVLENAPEEFFVRYDEPVSPARIRLLDQNGVEVELGEIQTTNEEIRFSSISPLIDGQYILSVRVISLDAHPIATSVGFSIGNLPPPIPEISEADFITRILLSLIQLIHLPVILVCIGLVLYPFIFSKLESQEPLRLRFLVITSLVGLVTTLLNMGLWGVLIGSEGIRTIFDINTWTLASTTTLGSRSGLLAGGLSGILLSIFLGQDYPAGRYLGLLGAILIALSFAASGHAAASGIFFKPVFIIHALIAGIWFGAVLILHAKTRTEDAKRLKALLIHFSDRAKYLVGALLICALLLVFHQLDEVSSLINSQYGLLLLLKIFLVISVLLIAVTNRWYFTPHLNESDPVTKSRLSRSIRIEILILFFILAVTTVLASISPRDVDTEPTSWTEELSGRSNLVVNLMIRPLQVGENMAELSFFKDEKSFDPNEVQVQWSHQSAGIEPVTQEVRRSDAGIYRVDNLNFLIPGEWTVRVNVLIDDFTRERLETVVMIK